MTTPLERIGVVGAGAMGRGIAQVAAQAGARVTLTDVSPEAAAQAREAIAASLRRAVAKGRLTDAAADAAIGRIATGTSLAVLADAALVIEAVVEDLSVKAEIFAALATATPGAIRASNTSALSIARLAEVAGGPVIGLHFFNPAHVMRLVEVILPPGSAHHGAVVEATLRAWGKVPVRAPDSPGFIVNRCARAFYGEALAMAEEGVAPGAIDAAVTAAGYPMGPFALIDLIGADVNLATSEGVWAAMGHHPRYHVFDILRRQVEAGRLGRKAGAGFVTPDPGDVSPAEGAVARIEAALVNEAAHLADEGGASESDIDTALKLGLNFPRGPFEIAVARGPAIIRDRLAALEADAPTHLKGRYVPAAALEAMERA